MRVLVLDECRLMTWVVQHVCPPGVDVVGLDSFEETCRAVVDDPPDAVIVSMTLAHLPWNDLRKLCAERTPPVPVLFESSLFSSAAEAGLEDDGPVEFLRKPASLADLRAALERLFAPAAGASHHLAS